MLTLVAFLVMIIIVVSVHEYGHYLAARLFGVRVLRFSVGFGAPFFIHTDKNGTEWAFAPIPLGGYVRMLDAVSAKQAELPEAEAVEAQSHWKRIIIYIAGPLANVVLAFFILLLLLSGGERGIQPIIGEVRAASPAAYAGLRSDDVIAAVNGKPTPIWRHAELSFADSFLAGEAVVIRTADDAVYSLPSSALSLDDADGGLAAQLGIYPRDDFIEPIISHVAPNSAAAAADLRIGDGLVMLNDAVIDHWREALPIIRSNAEKPVRLVLWRDDAALTTTVTVGKIVAAGRAIGHLGIAPTIIPEKLASVLVTVRYGPQQLLRAAATQTADDVRRTLGFIRLMLGGSLSADNLSGPVGIAVQSGEAAESGLLGWLRFVAVISISLAVINLLPLPVLDGGQVVMSVIQLIIRRDLPKRFLLLWDIIGVTFLLLLMAGVVANDIIRLLG